MITLNSAALRKSIQQATKHTNQIAKAEETANQRATGAIIRQAATRLVDESSKLTKVKKSVLRGEKQGNLKWRRLVVRVPQRTGPKKHGFVAFKTTPFNLHKIATASQMENGLRRRKRGGGSRPVKIKGREYPGAFWGRGRSNGNIFAFERRGNKSLPVDKVQADFTREFRRAETRVGRWVEDNFRPRYMRELEKARARIR